MEKSTESLSTDRDILFTGQSIIHQAGTMQCCQSYKLELGGRLPWTSYLFGLHPPQDLPWSVFVSDEELLLQSDECVGGKAKRGEACKVGLSLGKLDILVGILER